jgi:hypothetical protein
VQEDLLCNKNAVQSAGVKDRNDTCKSFCNRGKEMRTSPVRISLVQTREVCCKKMKAVLKGEMRKVDLFENFGDAAIRACVLRLRVSLVACPTVVQPFAPG